MPRLTKISTKKGDAGDTSLASGQRISKDAPRIQANGAVDELNSHLGAALALGLRRRLVELMTPIQNELFHLGADLSYVGAAGEERPVPQIREAHVAHLTAAVQELEESLGPLRNFIMPGGTPAAAQLHVARAVCRRAESQAVALGRQETIGDFVIPYLNRLSDLLFHMARYENERGGEERPLWDSRA